MKLLILPLLDILIGSWRYKLTLKINIWLDDAWNEILWMLFTTLLFFLQGISSMYFASGDHTFLSSSTIFEMIRQIKRNKKFTGKRMYVYVFVSVSVLTYWPGLIYWMCLTWRSYISKLYRGNPENSRPHPGHLRW